MKTLFLVDGASGTGKSDMVHYIATRKRASATVLPKYTTRKKRPEETNLKLDLIFPADSEDEFFHRVNGEKFYWYTYGNKDFGEDHYGFYKRDLDAALERRDFVFVIVRDQNLSAEIKKDYPEARVVLVFIHADRAVVEKRLKADGYGAEDIERRLSRQPLLWNDYIRRSADFDEFIINSADRMHYEMTLDKMLDKYMQTDPMWLQITLEHSYRLAAPLVGFKKRMLEKIEKYPFDKNVFLMMKFRGNNLKLYQYIQKTLESHGLNCVRADQEFWDITRNTYNPIAVLYCCKYGIALFDEPEAGNDYSPNVAYELGVMHSQAKECLVLRSSKIKTVPFDLVKELYVDYGDSLEIEGILNNWVKKIKSSF